MPYSAWVRRQIGLIKRFSEQKEVSPVYEVKTQRSDHMKVFGVARGLLYRAKALESNDQPGPQPKPSSAGLWEADKTAQDGKIMAGESLLTMLVKEAWQPFFTRLKREPNIY